MGTVVLMTVISISYRSPIGAIPSFLLYRSIWFPQHIMRIGRTSGRQGCSSIIYSAPRYYIKPHFTLRGYKEKSCSVHEHDRIVSTVYKQVPGLQNRVYTRHPSTITHGRAVSKNRIRSNIPVWVWLSPASRTWIKHAVGGHIFTTVIVPIHAIKPPRVARPGYQNTISIVFKPY